MILLKRLQLTNFLSHQDTIIDFDENEKALIDGASGAGKSSIFDAIIWALYGESRTENRSLVRKGTKMGAVVLTLKNDNEILVITRRVTSTGKNVLELMTEQPDGSKVAYPLSGIREIQNHIEKNVIGASYTLFVNSVAYVQGNTESFVSQTAPKRKELLLEIVKAEDYTKHYENARQTLVRLGNEENKASGQIVELEARFATLQAGKSDKNVHIETISRDTERIAILEPEISLLEDKRAHYVSAMRTLLDVDKMLTSAKQNADLAQLELARKTNKISVKAGLMEKLSTAPAIVIELDTANKHLESVRKALLSFSKTEEKRNEVLGRKPRLNDADYADLESTKVKIAKIKSQPVCPSGVQCPYSGDHDAAITQLHGSIGTIETKIKKDVEALDAWNAEFAALPPKADMSAAMYEIDIAEIKVRDLSVNLSRMESLQKDLSIIEEMELEIPVLKKDLEAKQEIVLSVRNSKMLAEAAFNKEEADAITGQIIAKNLERDGYKENIVRATSALETIDKNEEEAALTEQKLRILKGHDLKVIADKTRKVEMVKQAFGPKGIQTLVIDYLLPKLEDKINEVLSKLSDFRVHLDTQKKTADGDGVVEGLFITIVNELNEEMPFEAYSGGEKLKISVSISEALATLQKVGFRLFDETFIGLDENSTESFAQVLEGLQQNFSQVLCISHLLQIKELFDKKIQIVKNNNISYVK